MCLSSHPLSSYLTLLFLVSKSTKDYFIPLTQIEKKKFFWLNLFLKYNGCLFEFCVLKCFICYFDDLIWSMRYCFWCIFGKHSLTYNATMWNKLLRLRTCIFSCIVLSPWVGYIESTCWALKCCRYPSILSYRHTHTCVTCIALSMQSQTRTVWRWWCAYVCSSYKFVSVCQAWSWWLAVVLMYCNTMRAGLIENRAVFEPL